MIDLKGIRPDRLTNRETILDILQELEDTGNWKIEFIRLDGTNWRGLGKPATSWVESGVVSIFEADYRGSVLERFESDFSQSTISIKEKRWDVKRYPNKLKVTYSGGIRSDFRQVYKESNSVFLRLKDYISTDLIQDQFLYTNFEIDFIESDVRLIN